MPHIRSLFPSLPLSTPTINYYDWLLGRLALKSWPDFTLHIDGVTGERRQIHDVLERFEHAATALATSPKDGGLGLVAGTRIVGILSENCLVRAKKSLFMVIAPLILDVIVKGIPGSRVCPSQDSRADGVLSFAVHSSRNRGTFEAFWCHMLFLKKISSSFKERWPAERVFHA